MYDTMHTVQYQALQTSNVEGQQLDQKVTKMYVSVFNSNSKEQPSSFVCAQGFSQLFLVP